MTCCRRKSTILPEDHFLQLKKHLKQFFPGEKIGITSLLEDLDEKLLTPGQLLGYRWILGLSIQTSYVEGWWHQNWGSRQVGPRQIGPLADSAANRARTFLGHNLPFLANRAPANWAPRKSWCGKLRPGTLGPLQIRHIWISETNTNAVLIFCMQIWQNMTFFRVFMQSTDYRSDSTHYKLLSAQYIYVIACKSFD